ncbi:MAG: hypothetical protein QM647_08535 [Asticcacaulis sp.]|uniref:hypothetical protein n=1 Tax=Asticcacaulis sp. TaxID=1872648 RepID=UPI0039E5BD42
MKSVAITVVCASLITLPASATPLPSDIALAYKAAGMVQKDGHWTGCPDDDNGMADIQPEDYRDINGDGIADVVITDSGTFCYGMTGQGFSLLSKASGKWQLIYTSEGIPTFLPTKVKTPGGWPDVMIGGPGFCFPVMRWNGKTYVQNRKQADSGGSC